MGGRLTLILTVTLTLTMTFNLYHQLQPVVDSTVSVFGGAARRLATYQDRSRHARGDDAYSSYYDVGASASCRVAMSVIVSVSVCARVSVSGSECELSCCMSGMRTFQITRCVGISADVSAGLLMSVSVSVSVSANALVLMLASELAR